MSEITNFYCLNYISKYINRFNLLENLKALGLYKLNHSNLDPTISDRISNKIKLKIFPNNLKRLD